MVKSKDQAALQIRSGLIS